MARAGAWHMAKKLTVMEYGIEKVTRAYIVTVAIFCSAVLYGRIIDGAEFGVMPKTQFVPPAGQLSGR
jgi:hypothetical protein